MNASGPAHVKSFGSLRHEKPSPQQPYTNGHHTDQANWKESPKNLPITIINTSAIVNAANNQLGHVGMASAS